MLFDINTDEKIHVIIGVDRRLSTIKHDTYQDIFKYLYLFSNKLNRNISIFNFDSEIKQHWINITPYQLNEYCIKFLNKCPDYKNKRDMNILDVIEYMSNSCLEIYNTNERTKYNPYYKKFSNLQIEKVIGLIITDDTGLNINYMTKQNTTKIRNINNKLEILYQVNSSLNIVQFNKNKMNYNYYYNYNLITNLNIKNENQIKQYNENKNENDVQKFSYLQEVLNYFNIFN